MSDEKTTAKELICQILAAAGGRLEGRLRLYKAFYYAHLFYWQKGCGVLTEHAIVRMPWGPGIHEGKGILDTLQDEGRINITNRPIGPYREHVYELTGPFEINPKNQRYQAVEQAVEWVRNKSAIELSEETHVYSRSWREAKDGEVLDIYADLLDDEEYNQIREHVARTETLVNATF